MATGHESIYNNGNGLPQDFLHIVTTRLAGMTLEQQNDIILPETREMLYMLAEGRDYDQIGREFGLRGASHLIRRVTDEEQQRLAEHPLFQDLVAPSFPTNENGSVAPEGVHADEAMPPAPTQRRGRSFNTLPAASTLTDGENTSPSAYPRSHIAEIDAYEDQLSSEELREELEDELAPEEGDDILLDDSVRMYFQEIGRIPLLSAERERELAMSMQKAREEKQKPLDQQNARFMQAGKNARKEFINANLRLVVSVAKRYLNLGLSLSDMIGEGNIGLMRAVEKFDYTKGFKFSTYGTWWIRQAIVRAIDDQARTIRLPVHMAEEIHRLARITGELYQELGENPTPEQIAKKMRISIERVRELHRVTPDAQSLDTPRGGEEDEDLGYFVADSSTPSPADVVTQQLLKEEIHEALEILTPHEQEVLRLRFGLDDGISRTLEEVGKELRVTRERIRQIETRALRKLRHPSASRGLKDYLD